MLYSNLQTNPSSSTCLRLPDQVYMCTLSASKNYKFFKIKVLRIIANTPWFIRNIITSTKTSKCKKFKNRCFKTQTTKFHSSLLSSTDSMFYNILTYIYNHLNVD